MLIQNVSDIDNKKIRDLYKKEILKYVNTEENRQHFEKVVSKIFNWSRAGFNYAFVYHLKTPENKYKRWGKRTIYPLIDYPYEWYLPLRFILLFLKYNITDRIDVFSINPKSEKHPIPLKDKVYTWRLRTNKDYPLSSEDANKIWTQYRILLHSNMLIDELTYLDKDGIEKQACIYMSEFRPQKEWNRLQTQWNSKEQNIEDIDFEKFERKLLFRQTFEDMLEEAFGEDLKEESSLNANVVTEGYKDK